MKKVAAAVACAAAASAVVNATPSPKPFCVSSSSSSRHPTLLPRGGASHKDDKHSSRPSSANDNKNKKKKKRSSSTNRKSKDEESLKSSSKEESRKSTTDSKNGNSSPDSSPASPQEELFQELLNQDDYYAILGVSRTASEKEIQKAYRKRAVQTHPDKMPTGDRRAFDKVAEAYDVLSDDTKRSMYNRFGKKGLDVGATGRPPSSFTEDVFRSFFGTQFGSPQTRTPRNRTVRYQLEVSLEDLYNGMTRTVIVTQPGRKKVEVHIPKGMASGQSITLSGEMDQIPDATPADLIFVLVQRPHPVFTRKGHDLAMELTISLQEAICGVTRSIRHLDGRQISISSARQHDTTTTPVMIQTGDVHVLKGEGMPKHQVHDDGDDDAMFGDLYVQFKVEMPTSHTAKNNLTPEEREQLSKLLDKMEGKPRRSSKHFDQPNNIQYLQKASSADFGHASGPFRMEQEDVHNEDEGSSNRPSFPFGSRQFYFSSRNGNANDFDEDQNVQCQQM